TIYFHKWTCKQDRQQNIGQIGPVAVKLALRLTGVDPFPFAIITNGPYGIPKPFILINYFSFRAHNAPLLLYLLLQQTIKVLRSLCPAKNQRASPGFLFLFFLSLFQLNVLTTQCIRRFFHRGLIFFTLWFFGI